MLVTCDIQTLATAELSILCDKRTKLVETILPQGFRRHGAKKKIQCDSGIGKIISVIVSPKTTFFLFFFYRLPFSSFQIIQVRRQRSIRL